MRKCGRVRWSGGTGGNQANIANNHQFLAAGGDREERKMLKGMQQGMTGASVTARNMGPHSNMRWSGRRARSVRDRKGRSGWTVRYETKQGAIAQW